MEKPTLRVLLIEDSEFDAQLLLSFLRKGGYELYHERVETGVELRQALGRGKWDVIIADYNLPQFSGPEALQILQELGVDLPFIIVSGGIGEDTAVAAMKAGAHDYLMKGNMTRLLPAVEREIREAGNREGRRQAKEALRESELRYRLLWETATDAVIQIDTESIIHFANPAVFDVFGYEPSEVVGKSLSILQPPELRQAHQRGVKHFLRGGKKNVNWRAFETRALRKDGVEIPIEVAFSDMLIEGTRWFVGFIRDISERKKAERELRENQEQFRVAREIQQHLFPRNPPNPVGLEIAGASRPAEATGGDYFDYLPMLRECLGVVVGDVTGHGVGPALLMAETRAYLRILARDREDPAEILNQANAVLAEDVGAERYVSILLARLDPCARTLNYVNAGHPPAYILDSDGKIKTTLKRSGPPLGLRRETTYSASQEVPLLAGDIVLLLTDGFEEAIADDDEPFGVERVIQAVHENREASAELIVQKLYDKLTAFTQGRPQADDLTVIVVKVTA